jgi:hypothetical protein
VTVAVTAPGYMPEEKDLPADAVRAIEPAHLFESIDHRPAGVVVELYADPRPTVELVLLPGYRGLVRAEVIIQDDAACPPGQRRFSAVVPPTGVVQVVGPPLLRRVFAPDFSARYADGAPLSQNAKDTEIGYWWLKCEGSVQIFFIGTPKEFEDLRRSQEPQDAGLKRTSGGGKGEGKGGGRRGGHRGGQSQSGAPM